MATSNRSSRAFGEGSVVERKRKTGTFYAIRFVDRAGTRQWQNLGSAKLGWTRKRAEEVLRDTLTDVARGVWVDPSKIEPEPEPVPTFHEFASEWLATQKRAGGRNGRGLSRAGSADLEWRLSFHLLPWFADKKLDEITVQDVDRYKDAKLLRNEAIGTAAAKGKPIMHEYTDGRGRKHRRAARPLSNTSINKTLATLAAILQRAVKYKLIDGNPALESRLPSVAPPRSFLDRAEHIRALVDAAGKLDESAYVCKGQRRLLVATLVFAGLRIGEALSLRWQDIDLARGTIKVRAAKTAAGERDVKVLPVLYDELASYKARVMPAPGALVFGTSTGAKQGATNVRRRLLAPAVELANTQLAKQGKDLLPEGLTPHSLRRTFASLLFAIGVPPTRAMRQMGHTSASLTLEVYARDVDDDDDELERINALVNDGERAQLSLRPATGSGHLVGTREHMMVDGGRS